MGAPYRVGVIGLSGISTAKPERKHGPYRSFLPHSHVSAYYASPLTEIVAVCDIFQSAIDNFRTLWQSEATGYTDFREMLANEQIDLLSIVTPDHLHAESFIAACEAGVKGIYCEKPVSTTLEDADRMIAAAKASGTKVIVNHTRRFDPYYRHARWLVDEGKIGTVQQIMGTMGGERAMLFRNGTHVIDTMLFFANEQPSWVMAVFDEIDANYGPTYKGDGGRDPRTDPSASAIIGFPSGVRAFYNGSKRTVTNFEIDVQGDSGRIRMGNQIAEIATESAIGGLATQPLPINADTRSGMVQAIDELAALIEQDGDGVKALYEARTTLELLLAILTSADRGGARIELSGAPS
jgi:predicted dehydrogenase